MGSQLPIFPSPLMDLQLLGKGLDFCKKKKKWIFLLALFGASGFGVYKVYHLPSVERKRRKLLKLLTAFFSVVELVSDSADTFGVLSKDLKKFIKSDSNDIPNSLKQVCKIARSDEFSDSLSKISEALAVGILRGYGSETSNEGGNGTLVDQVIGRVLSNAGTGFVSVVAGSFAWNLVMGFYSSGESVEGSNEVRVERVPGWVGVICSDKCKELMGSCLRVFVSTAVAVYLEKTMDINTYDEIFSGLTNPNHENKVKDLMVSVCNSSVETFVKTSYQVLTSSNFNSDNAASTSHSCADSKLVDRQVSNNIQSGGWGSMVMSTLAVPSNRRFVLDVTGRVTFESFKSLVEFLKWKVSDGLRRSKGAIHDRVVDRGLQVVRYVGFNSYLLVTICLALFLHVVCGTITLLPA